MSTSQVLHSLPSVYIYKHATLNITLISFLKNSESEFTSSSSVSSEILNLVSLEGISKQKISFTSFFHLTSLMEFCSQMASLWSLMGIFCHPLGSLPLYHLTADLACGNRAVKSSLEGPCSCCPEKKLS